MNQPMKLILESHGNKYTWEGPWDSGFDDLLDVFLGFCSTAGFQDKGELLESIWRDVEDQHALEKEWKKEE